MSRTRQKQKLFFFLQKLGRKLVGSCSCNGYHVTSPPMYGDGSHGACKNVAVWVCLCLLSRPGSNKTRLFVLFVFGDRDGKSDRDVTLGPTTAAHPFWLRVRETMALYRFAHKNLMIRFRTGERCFEYLEMLLVTIRIFQVIDDLWNNQSYFLVTIYVEKQNKSFINFKRTPYCSMHVKNEWQPRKKSKL